MKYRVLASFIWALVYIVALVVFLFVFGGLALMSGVFDNLPF
jgi:hypothetical protein